MDKLWNIPFFLPKNSKLHLSLIGVRSIFKESIGAVTMKIILKKILKIKSFRDGVFLQKVMKNVKYRQKFAK